MASTPTHPPAKVFLDSSVVIVAGAQTAGADILVTYDRKHLLANKDVIHEHFQVAVATPAEALRLLGFT